MIRATLMIIVAFALLILVLVLGGPVVINWPDSWFGLVLIALLFVSALVLMYKAVVLIKRQGEEIAP